MLTVDTLGKVQLEFGGIILREDEIRSSMLTKLFAYLLLHREQSMKTEDIIEALWEEGEVDNPAGALKNLMYRLRNLLKKSLGRDDFILTNRGAYQWNAKIPVKVDAEEFEALIEQARSETASKDRKIALYEQAIALYQGDFMPGITELHWIITLNAYYHSLFLVCVKELAELYLAEERYAELESVCNEALRYDKVDESLHYYLILARIRMNNWKLGMQSYEEACQILTKELGVHKFTKLEEVYEELLKLDNGGHNVDIDEVREEMAEREPDGVFFCGYPVFRELYRLESRKISRQGGTEYILLFTVETTAKETEQVEQFRIKNAMNHLQDILQKSLRIGDVASRYNESQYIVLLPACTYEGSIVAAERIMEYFESESTGHRNVKVKVNSEKVSSFTLPD
jgi:DNA-binding SARP family transcriptional activator